jgi:hypothetical protein
MTTTAIRDIPFVWTDTTKTPWPCKSCGGEAKAGHLVHVVSWAQLEVKFAFCSEACCEQHIKEMSA